MASFTKDTRYCKKKPQATVANLVAVPLTWFVEEVAKLLGMCVALLCYAIKPHLGNVGSACVMLGKEMAQD